MNKTALIFGIGASFILAAGAANAAGTCGADVAALQQQMGMDEGANATIGATDPGVQQPSPSASVDTSTGTSTTTNGEVAAGTANQDNNANATIGATDPGVQQPAPEANATTGTSSNSTTNGSSTTESTGANATIGATDPGVQQPQDMDSTDDADTSASSGTSAMPSGDVTETSRVGELNTAAGGRAAASTALKKAQLAADAGDESTCMSELGTAKAALGVQ
jgi:hypothetical protein